MDIMKGTTTPGQILSDVTYVDHGWVKEQGQTIHTNALCHKVTDEYKRAAVCERDGQLYIVVDESMHQAYLCKKCPPRLGDDTWKERAACIGKDMYGGELSAPEREKLLEICANCPVVRECFLYGAATPELNGGFVWGGIYFPTWRRNVKAAIEKRKVELGLG